MKTINIKAVSRSLFTFGAALLITLFVVVGSAFAQTTPPAGTLIGNQATATFNDAGGNPRTVTSNVVNTQVSQIAALTLTAPQTKTVSPGGQLAFPHTVTNNGNGTDRFTLSGVQAGDYTLTSINFYEDLDGNGVPDNFTPITQTTNIAPGVSFNFVAVVVVPNSALDGEEATLSVTATSQFDNLVNKSLDDVARVSDNAVINLTKSMSANIGDPGSTPYTVTLTYTNSGNATGTAFTVTDALPTHMDYIAGTGRWSVTGASALSDADDVEGASPNITYKYVAGTRTLTAIIASVAPGQSGTISFQVGIAAIAPPGTLNNTATFEYNDGAANVGPFNSNTYIFTVNSTPGVTGVGETIASATQGSTVVFTNAITNDGNITDKFNISIQSNSFPVGSSYILYKSDGLSPLLDTNSDGIPDTGPLVAGATYNVILKVTLPNSASAGGPYTIVKRATSINNPSVFDDMNDILTTIAGNSVDITVDKDIVNDAATIAEGLGAGPEGSPVKTNATNPGTTTRFTIYVNNTTAVSDNYDLAVSTDQTFATQVVPLGTVITFKDVTNSVISNTGTILANSQKLVYVDITVPANKAATATPESYYVRALSPASTAVDRIHLGLTVNAIRDMAVSPNNSGQVFPGGSVVYIHTITNNGNVVENNAGTEFALSASNSNGGFSAVLYIDINSDGVIDGGDVLVNGTTNFGAFNPGQSKQVILKVTATPGVTEGLINTSTITATLTGDVNGVTAPIITVATDVTTVINSNVTLNKKQAKDADDDGTADGAFVTTQVTAKPGEGILYQIVVSNLGTTTVTAVQINDAIPSYTTYNSAKAAVATTKGTASFDNGTKTITVVVGDLTAGESATITFGVLIDN